MIKLMVIGNLGKDCTVNNVNGKNVINFSVAHTEKFKDSSGMQREKTIWVECAWWTERTGIVPYLKKGSSVYAEGSPDIRTYTLPDGKQGASMKLTIQNVQLLGSRNAEGGAAQGDHQQAAPSSYGANNNYNQNSYGQQNNYPQNGYNQAPAAQSHQSVSPGEITEPMDDLPF